MLLVHGYPASSHMWRPALDAIAARGLYAIAPDLPGFGDSEPGPPGTNTWTGHVEALEALPRVEVDGGMHCVARTSVVGLRWGGVRLREVVDLMPPEDGAEHVLLAAVRGYAASVHLEDVLHPDALLATHVDGAPLTPEHGWPARVVLPHLYGFKGPKWVVEMTYHHQEQQGWWESRGYHPRARVDREERWAHQG